MLRTLLPVNWGVRLFNMSKKIRPPLTLPEYERIFRVIHSILLAEEADTSKSCLFFNIAGAFILSNNHGHMNARPIAGLAGYNLRTRNGLSLVLGKVEQGKVTVSSDEFHCWVELDDWIIDFSAPLFNSMVDPQRAEERIPPKMFQRLSSDRVLSLNELNTPGAYLHIPSQEVTTELMLHFSELQANADLVKICADWHRCPPKRMQESIGVANQHGQVNDVHLSKIYLEGAW